MTRTLPLFLALALLCAGQDKPAKPAKNDKPDIYAFNLPDIKGKMISFQEFKGKVLLIVNVASNSSFTDQYAGLEALYQKHKEQGFVVLAFPSNDFGAEEPDSEAKIQAFCESKFHLTFPLFSKISVRGDDITPLYSYLTKEANPKLKGEVHWNFTKFLVNRKGKLVSRFSSDVSPDDPDLIVAIEDALNKTEKATEKAQPDSTKDDSDRRPPDGA